MKEKDEKRGYFVEKIKNQQEKGKERGRMREGGGGKEGKGTRRGGRERRRGGWPRVKGKGRRKGATMLSNEHSSPGQGRNP